MSESSFWEKTEEIELELGNAGEDMSPEAKAGVAGAIVAAKREILSRLNGWASDEGIVLRDLLRELYIQYVEQDGELVKYGEETK
jgi:hypothetical protein